MILSVLPARTSWSQHSPPASSPPATTQVSPEEEARRERAAVEAEVRQLPTKQVGSVRDVLRFAKKDERLFVESILNDVEFGATTHLLVGDLPGIVTLQPRESLPLGDEPRDFNFMEREMSDPPKPVIHTTVSAVVGRISVVRDEESETFASSVQYIQDPQVPDPDPTEPPVRLYISRDNKLTQQREVDLKLNAKSFTELYLRHPRAVDQYLRPILRDLKQEAAVFAPDPKAAWQVLGANAKVDPQAAAKVEQALAKLDAQSFQEREAALAALQEIGEPAALVLMRADRSKLSADKQSGVDSFLAPYLPLSPEDVKRMSEDKSFLLNVLSADDLELRRLGWDRLAKITGTPNAFDPAADDATRAAQVAKLRETTLDATTTDPPSTKPADR